MLSSVVPAPMVTVPPPNAVLLLIRTEPPLRLKAPVPEFAPPKVSAPALVFVTAALKITLLLTTSEPLGSTSHVCGLDAATVRGEATVTAPPPVSTRLPPEALTGAKVSVPPIPGLTVTAVMPAGTFGNCMLSIIKGASSVVVICVVAVNGALVALKTAVSDAPGTCVALIEPAKSVDQLVSGPALTVFHELSVWLFVQ